jgi:hypothetical protein
VGVRIANDFHFQPVKHVAAWFGEGIIGQVQQGGKKIDVFWVNFKGAAIKLESNLKIKNMSCSSIAGATLAWLHYKKSDIQHLQNLACKQ